MTVINITCSGHQYLYISTFQGWVGSNPFSAGVGFYTCCISKDKLAWNFLFVYFNKRLDKTSTMLILKVSAIN